MLSLAIACSALLAAAPEPEPADPRVAYRAAVASAGRDADAQVKLALWCEAHGLQAERFKHLALALLADPANAAARGLMGLVADAGKWRKPEAVAARIRADAELSAALAEYNSRRAKAPNTAEAQWKLALWCEGKGLKAEATAHLAAVVRLDPKREAAWRRLGYTKQKDGRWATAEQVAAARDEAEARRKADLHWRPLLEKLKGQLAKQAKRTEAEDRLAKLTDHRAVPMILRVFGAGGEADQSRAAQLLGQIDAPAASRGLAMLAVFGKTPAVRAAAAQTLRGRDPREFAGVLIGLLRDPIKYQVRPVGGPGSPGALFVAGKKFDVQRLYSPPPIAVSSGVGSFFGFDNNGLPVIVRGDEVGAIYTDQQNYLRLRAGMMGTPNPSSSDKAELNEAIQQLRGDQAWIETRTAMVIAEAKKAAAVAQQQLVNDVNAIESYNLDARMVNSRATAALAAVAGEDFGDQLENWRGWWTNQLGYSYAFSESDSKPTITLQIPLVYEPESYDWVYFTRHVRPLAISCFAAGTPVRTLEGPRPIESLKVGDRVLTQDTGTGSLNYRPILIVHHNPPARTLRVKMRGESIVSSTFHRFWIAGKGWAMARDLKPGDVIRTLGGLATVSAIEEDKVQPVFNLDVAGDRDFFAGNVAALVHDNSVPEPRQAPFDAPAAVASSR